MQKKSTKERMRLMMRGRIEVKIGGREVDRRIREYVQDDVRSLLDEKGRYDYTHFSEHEVDIIHSVLEDNKQITKEYRAIYLTEAAWTIKYKPRHVLYKAAIMLYSKSDAPLDVLAVARAYTAEGYYYLNDAVRRYDSFLAKHRIEDFSLLPYSLYPRRFYTETSKVYEEAGRYKDALALAEQCKKYAGILPMPDDWSQEMLYVDSYTVAVAHALECDRRIDAERLQRLTDKINAHQSVAPRKPMGAKRRALEDQIERAAACFVKYF